MKLYKRSDFIRLPAGTIYSRVNKEVCDLCYGLFCKTSNSEDYTNDWVEQDLISEAGYPTGIDDKTDGLVYKLNLRDLFLDFRTDLDCAGRDGCFDDSDVFVVWDAKDINALIGYLQNALIAQNERAPKITDRQD